MSDLPNNQDLDNDDLYNIDGKKKSERKEINELPAEKKFKILNLEVTKYKIINRIMFQTERKKRLNALK